MWEQTQAEILLDQTRMRDLLKQFVDEMVVMSEDGAWKKLRREKWASTYTGLRGHVWRINIMKKVCCINCGRKVEDYKRWECDGIDWESLDYTWSNIFWDWF